MSLGLLLATSTSILVAGQPVDVGRPVVLWRDPEGFNGYAQQCVERASASQSRCCSQPFRRYSERKGLRTRNLEALRDTVSQLVLHLDGCVNSRSCFYSMHDLPRPDGGCGLSAHFMIDADGTIYQTLDVLERAWHAEEVNSISIGVEMCNRGDADRHELDRLPADYRTRAVKEIVVNGHRIHAFDFRPEQYEAVIALARALVHVFPRIRPVFPEQGTEPLLETLRNPLSFAGIVGHLHVDLQRHKWDPGAFDWKRLKQALHGFYFPLALRNYESLPSDASTLAQASLAYARNAEERATGFFPVAPSRLWHSGLHLRAAAGEPVVAPTRGRLVAARMAASNGSSTSFVLLRHELMVEDTKVVFFTLLYHLAPEPIDQSARAPWLADLVREGNPQILGTLRRGAVALLDRSVEAGDIVGTVGTVLRGTEQGPELHVEVFSPQRLTGPLGRVFRFVDASTDKPFVKREALLAPLAESGGAGLKQLFASGLPLRQALRRLAIRHAHEWGDRMGEQAYVHAKELSGWSEAERRLLYQRAIAPYQFWSSELSAHAGLPASQIVYFYHPITFWVALWSRAQNVSTHWPPVMSLDNEESEPSALASSALADWEMGAAEATGPLFGPVVDAEVAPRRKSDIPLIILPSVGD